MSPLVEFMMQDSTVKTLIEHLPSEENLKITVNHQVVSLADFVSFHCTSKVEEASITFRSGLVLGFGPTHHHSGFQWGTSLLPASPIDRSYIGEILDVIRIFVAKANALREYTRWLECHKVVEDVSQVNNCKIRTIITKDQPKRRVTSF